MLMIARAVITAFAASSFASVADAKSAKKRKHVRQKPYVATQPYPYTSERQRHNAFGYETGGYYERLQSAHPFGSRGWWEFQGRRR